MLVAPSHPTPTSLNCNSRAPPRKIRSVYGGRQIEPGPGKAGCDMKQCPRGNDAGIVRALPLSLRRRCARSCVFETFSLRRGTALGYVKLFWFLSNLRICNARQVRQTRRARSTNSAIDLYVEFGVLCAQEKRGWKARAPKPNKP